MKSKDLVSSTLKAHMGHPLQNDPYSFTIFDVFLLLFLMILFQKFYVGCIVLQYAKYKKIHISLKAQ